MRGFNPRFLECAQSKMVLHEFLEINQDVLNVLKSGKYMVNVSLIIIIISSNLKQVTGLGKDVSNVLKMKTGPRSSGNNVLKVFWSISKRIKWKIKNNKMFITFDTNPKNNETISNRDK